MTPDGVAPNDSNDPDQVDPWVQAQLSTYQLRWLKTQCCFASPAKLLKNALVEWVIRHPDDWLRGTRICDAIRLALNEFIDRHKDEFLKLD
jgi:hypothetical protein